MKKASKLKLCNWALLIAAPIILASGIQLEATGGRDISSVWFHIVAGTAFCILAIWHISLNINGSNWFRKFQKLKSPVTRILWWLFLLTVISAIFAFCHWIGSYLHSPVGGIHGKLGFAMIAVAIGHTVKRFRFFKPRKAK